MLLQSKIELSANKSGLRLSKEEIFCLAETEQECLFELKRISFGESAVSRLIREFASSSFLTSEKTGAIISELTEGFYEVREDLPAEITDLEIIEALRSSFEGEAAGDVSLAILFARSFLKTQVDTAVYEIIDDDGNLYRWDPEEWHDDITSDGWYGEKWSALDE